MALRFSCGLNGQCQEDPHGRYRTLASCQRECHAVEGKELHYLIYGYTLDSALHLAPRDRIELVKRETRTIVDDDDSYNILLGLGTEDLFLLARYPVLYPYLQITYPSKELYYPLLESGTFEALRILTDFHPFSTAAMAKYLAASNYNPRVLTALHATIPQVLERELASSARKSVPALDALLLFYPNTLFTVATYPKTTAVLEKFVARGMTAIVDQWAEGSYIHPTSLPVIRWYLRRYPQLRNAANVVIALIYDRWNFVQLAANSKPLGLAAAKMFANVAITVDEAMPRRALHSIDALIRLANIASLPEPTMFPFARQIWNYQLLQAVSIVNTAEWVASIEWLHEFSPAWYTPEKEDHILVVDDYAITYNAYSDAQHMVINEYLESMDMIPSIDLLVLKTPQLLDVFNATRYSEEEVRAVVDQVIDPRARRWIVDYYPGVIRGEAALTSPDEDN